MVMHCTRDIDRAWFAQAFEACRDVHAVAMNVIAVGDHVTNVDADSERDSFLLDQLRIAHRVHRTAELNLNAIAPDLDHATAVFGD